MATDAPPSKDPPHSGFIEQWLETPTKKVVAVAAGIGSVVGAVVGVIHLWGIVFPPAKSISATISPLERPLLNQTLGDFLGSHPGAVPGTFTAKQRQTNGDVFTVRLELKGAERALLIWTELDGNTKQPLPVATWTPTQTAIGGSGGDQHLTRDVWAPIALVGDSMFLRFTVTVPGRTDPVAVEDGPIVPIG